MSETPHKVGQDLELEVQERAPMPTQDALTSKDTTLPSSNARQLIRRFEVVPRNPTNASEAERIDVHLNTKFGEGKVEHWSNGKDRRWLVRASQEGVQDLDTYDGIESVDRTRLPFPPRPRRQKRATSEDVPTTYCVAAKDPKDAEGSTNIINYINSLVPDPDSVKTYYSTEVGMTDKIKYWDALEITKDQADELAKRDEVFVVTESSRKRKRLILPKAHREFETDHIFPSTQFEGAEHRELTKRSVVWKKQVGARDHLIAVSQFPGSNIRDLNFVFDSRAGGGVYIYIIEEGINCFMQPQNPNDPNNPLPLEFPYREASILTQSATLNPGIIACRDDDRFSHGTIVAAAALGQEFGIAKHATLIEVRFDGFGGSLWDMDEAMRLVANDIHAKGRQKSAVVTLTIGNGPPGDGRGMDPVADKVFERVQMIHALGVPIITPAGNDRIKEGRDQIDFWPSMWASDDDVPLINVAEVDRNGIQSPHSQGGNLVGTWAYTDKILMPYKDGIVRSASGNSLGCGIVAGVLALFMATGSDQPTWDPNLRGTDRVKAILDFLRTKPFSGWTRPSFGGVNGERAVWDGAQEQDHNGATPWDIQADSAPGDLHCYDLGTNKFGRKKTFAANVEDICGSIVVMPPANADGPFVKGTYNAGELQEAVLRYDWPTDGSQRIQEDTFHCIRMFQRILKECDNPPNNFMGFGAGGEVHLGGTVYTIQPSNERQPWVQNPTGGCYFRDPPKAGFASFSQVEIYGLGWEGSGLMAQMKSDFPGNRLAEEPTFDYDHQQDRDWTFKALVLDLGGYDSDDAHKIGAMVTNAIDWDVSIDVSDVRTTKP